MTISDERVPKKVVWFEDIERGECFEFETKIYMKTETYMKTEQCVTYCNAICMLSGQGTYFKKDEDVLPVKGELVISELCEEDLKCGLRE